MKIQEIIERLRKGEVIEWIEWKTKKYKLNNETIRHAQIKILRNFFEKRLYEYYNNNAPLTGGIKLRQVERLKDE